MAKIPDAKEHFSELDGMRGILATLVMLMHYGLDRGLSHLTHGLLTNSIWELSVDFFFVLSGFVLARSFERSRPDIRTYFIRRAFRLAPMFLITMLVALWIGHLKDYDTVIANLTMMQSVFGFESINFPSWSIPFEFVIPALGIPLVTAWAKWSSRLDIIFFTLFLIGATISVFLLAKGYDIRALRAFAGLGLGFALFRLFGARLRSLGGRPLATGFCFGGIVLLMLLGHRFTMLTLVFPLLVSITVVIGATTYGLMSTALARALGRWSYSIYLVHIPMLLLAEKLLGQAAVGHNPALKLFLACISIFVAALCNRWIEVPLAFAACPSWIKASLARENRQGALPTLTSTSER